MKEYLVTYKVDDELYSQIIKAQNMEDAEQYSSMYIYGEIVIIEEIKEVIK